MNKMEWIPWDIFPVPEDVRGILIKYEEGIFSDRYDYKTGKRKYRDSKIIGWRFMERLDPREKTVHAIMKQELKDPNKYTSINDLRPKSKELVINSTELTIDDIDKFVNKLINEEIKTHQCLKCGKIYYMESYGHHIGECDECWFSRFPKEEVEAFCRTFFE